MKKTSIYLLILIILMAGCRQIPSEEDILHGDILYNDILVEQITDSKRLSSYHYYLFDYPTEASMEAADLIYELNLRTYEHQYRYLLAFDLQKQKAVAIGKDGTVRIPFKWVHGFLSEYPIPEAFAYLMPPDLQVTIDGYPMIVGQHQTWNLHPTEEISYLIEAKEVHSVNYKTTSPALVIKGDFDSKPADSLNLKIIGTEGTDTYSDVNLEGLPTPEDEGAYRYELTALWQSPEEGYSGSITYNFGLSISRPTRFLLNDTLFEPGDCMSLLIENPKDLDYRVETGVYNKTIGLFYLEENLTGLIPLDPDTVPGSYTLSVYRDSSNKLLETFSYEVLPKEFNTQNLIITGSKSTLKSDENRAKDAEKFKNARAYSVGEKLWEGTFIQPVEGRISTEYATKRHTNGSASYYRHGGIDIAAPLGTPVLADNTGIITFASDLIIAGNTIVIDHGYGLFSKFIHLDKIYVEEGDTVQKGDLIGAVGTTGFSTGPHLDWSIWKNGVYINPWKLMEEDPLEVFE